MLQTYRGPCPIWVLNPELWHVKRMFQPLHYCQVFLRPFTWAICPCETLHARVKLKSKINIVLCVYIYICPWSCQALHCPCELNLKKNLTTAPSGSCASNYETVLWHCFASCKITFEEGCGTVICREAVTNLSL